MKFLDLKPYFNSNMNQNNKNMMVEKEQCSFCKKYFKRLNAHKCKMQGGTTTTTTTSSSNETNLMMMMGTMMTQFMQVFKDSKDEDRKLREEEARRRKEEREEEARRRKEERQEDMDFQLQLLKANQYFKERMVNKKIEAAERTTQRYIEAMSGNHRQERQRLDVYHQRQITCQTETNNKNRRLSIGPVDTHQKDELVVYGTPALPLVKYDDVKKVMDEIVFEPQVLNLFVLPPESSEQKEEDELRESVHETLQACSVKKTCLVDGIDQADEFIELRTLDKLVKEFEDDAKLETKVYQAHMNDMNKHMPYSPYFGCEIMKEKDFEEKFQQDDYNLMGDDDVFEVVCTENIQKPSKVIEEIEAIDIDNPKDDSTPEESDVVLEWGCSLKKEDAVGIYDESPTSLKLFLQKRIELRQKLIRFFDCLDHTEKGRFRRNMRLQGLARLRCRLVIIKMRLKKTGGSYIPDFMERYLHDQLFQQKNCELVPHARKYKTCFTKNKKGFFCTHCGTSLHEENFEKGHVVPSKGKTTGSNFWYNIISLCASCNTRMGSKDAYLDAEYRVTSSFL